VRSTFPVQFSIGARNGQYVERKNGHIDYQNLNFVGKKAMNIEEMYQAAEYKVEQEARTSKILFENPIVVTLFDVIGTSIVTQIGNISGQTGLRSACL
jgi:hypothetical protein